MKKLAKTSSSSLQIKDEFLLLLCPFCKKHIPDFRFGYTADTITLIVSCICLPKEKQIFLSQYLTLVKKEASKCRYCFNRAKHGFRTGEKYCLTCSFWLCNECLAKHKESPTDKQHILDDFTLIVKCHEHNAPFSFYCRDCRMNMCAKCTAKHDVTHARIHIEVNNELIHQRYKDVVRNVTLYKDSSDYYSWSLDRFKLWYNFSNQHKLTNDHLELFYYILCSTADCFKDYPTYHLMSLHNRIVVNTIKEHRNRLDNYFFTDYYVLFQRHQSIVKVNQRTGASCKIHKRLDRWPTSLNHEYQVDCMRSQGGRLLTVRRETLYRRFYHYSENPQDYELLVRDSNLDIQSSLILKTNSFIQLSDGRLVLFEADYMRIMDLTTREYTTILIEKGRIKACLQRKNGQLAVCWKMGLIKWYDCNTFKGTSIQLDDSTKIKALIELNDECLLAGTNAGFVLINTTTLQTEICLKNQPTKSVIQLKDGRLCYSFERTISIWNIAHKSDEHEEKLVGHREKVKCLLEINGRLLASAGKDSLRIWNIALLTCIFIFKEHKKCRCLVELDDKRIAYCYKGNVIIRDKDDFFLE